MKLIIEGSDKKIKQLAKELKTRARRTNLSLSLQETKKQEGPLPPPVKDIEPTVENKEANATETTEPKKEEKGSKKGFFSKK